VPCVLVSFGPEGPAIARLEPDAMLERFADLAAVAGRLVPEAAELVP
jgi:phosphoglycolate phosphatase